MYHTELITTFHFPPQMRQASEYSFYALQWQTLLNQKQAYLSLSHLQILGTTVNPPHSPMNPPTSTQTCMHIVHKKQLLYAFKHGRTPSNLPRVSQILSLCQRCTAAN